MDRQMRTWAEIDLDRIERNYRNMRQRLPAGTKFLAVVKANAYGHGAVRVARLMQETGADYLAVACLDEAVQLRQAGIALPILILGYTPPKYAPELIKFDITQAVSDTQMARELSAAAEGFGRVRAHLKLDSGMGRLGFTVHSGADSFADIADALSLSGLDYEGVFTHFAVSDVAGQEEYTHMQYAAFKGMTDKIEAELGVKFKIKHCTNSGAMLSYKETYLDMVRPGIALYGCYPEGESEYIELQPAMSLKTRIAQIKTFDAGRSVSYGRTYKTETPRRVAVLTIGYADGLHRVLSNNMQVLVRGQRCDQIGRICMDMCMADVTDVPDAQVGDEVVVFGADGAQTIPVEEQALKAGTISY
ncbi:MAG: alanine racemase, partial [Oscillospiraceae bacterium]|nr:alanine racemase [Oscillospiraceae bacterium]